MAYRVFKDGVSALMKSMGKQGPVYRALRLLKRMLGTESEQGVVKNDESHCLIRSRPGSTIAVRRHSVIGDLSVHNYVVFWSHPSSKSTAVSAATSGRLALLGSAAEPRRDFFAYTARLSEFSAPW